MEINQIMDKLTEGNQRFVTDQLENASRDASRRGSLVEGQSPFAIVLSCADSRVVPEMVFDTGLGELFVIRVAGNVANTDSIASIEYAVAQLKTKLIVVMGHQSCGAVSAAMAGGDLGKNLNHLLAQIKPAIESSEGSTSVNEVVKANAHLVSQNLVNNSAILQEAVEKNELKIVPGYYNLDSGKVDFL